MSVPYAIQLRYPVPRVETWITRPAMQESTDNELVKLATRDELAFEELVRRYQGEVYRLCRYFTRDREEAWDLSQETFVKVYRGLRSFRGEASFKTWLLRIAANTAKDYLKKRRLNVVPLEEWQSESLGGNRPGPDALAHGKELGEAIERAMESLSPVHRLALTLREMEGLSYQEMAEVMKCRTGTVMSRLHHARHNLRERLTEMGYIEGN